MDLVATLRHSPMRPAVDQTSQLLVNLQALRPPLQTSLSDTHPTTSEVGLTISDGKGSMTTSLLLKWTTKTSVLLVLKSHLLTASSVLLVRELVTSTSPSPTPVWTRSHNQQRSMSCSKLLTNSTRRTLRSSATTSIRLLMQQDVTVVVPGRSMNTSTNHLIGFLKPITPLEQQMETTVQTFLPTIKTQPTLCGLVNTRPTAVVTNGLDMAVTGTMPSL